MLKNVKFEFALKVGDIHECRLIKITVGPIFFFKFSRKLVIFETIWTPGKDFCPLPLKKARSPQQGSI